MNLPAANGGVSRKRCIRLRGSFCKEIINCRVYYHLIVSVTNANRPKAPPPKARKGV
jgi:hypothetical protein